MYVGDWKKSPIRHPEYLNGWVVNYRYKPDTARTVVWQVCYVYIIFHVYIILLHNIYVYIYILYIQVRFSDAPGGPQVFEMEETELKTCMQRYQEWMRAEACNQEGLDQYYYLLSAIYY